jgi:large subunit ribosomal protein L30
MADNKLKITLKRSITGCLGKHKLTVKALGLRKLGQTVVQNDTPQIRGMIRQVGYLLAIEEQ